MYSRKENPVKNTFTVELVDDMTDESVTVNVYQPKISLIRKLTRVAEGENGIEIIDSMLEILAEALSRNAEKKTITADFLADMLDTEDMSSLFEDYFQWVQNLKKK
ncbi:MAG: hypothetical protein MJ095_03770 [Oscillospiraceae bacterium]|nr:hypothetical protein [Oscillospiraceae bacterium]